jgi:hypothetical protein
MTVSKSPQKKRHGDILETLRAERAGQGAQVLEIPIGRGDRAVEGARLEIVCTPNKGTEGSNPSLSARKARSGESADDRAKSNPGNQSSVRVTQHSALKWQDVDC